MPNDLTFTIDRRRALSTLAAASAGALWTGLAPADLRAACCYFAAKDKDVNQPAQKAFLTWDPERMRESFTVQPKFEGNASDFGMVIPTPSQPKLDEMPRDFFRVLAVFTILEPMPLDKYKRVLPLARSVAAGAAVDKPIARRVVVLEEGVVGSLDYKIIRAEDARDLYHAVGEGRGEGLELGDLFVHLHVLRFLVEPACARHVRLHTVR